MLAAQRLPIPELHQTDRPSSTAQWTALGRALELGRPAAQRIVSDGFAPVFLSRASRGVLAPLTLAGPVTRAAERAGVAALATSGLSRHAFIDDHLLTALPHVEQVLVLGAGYDTRAYRFAAELAGRPVYEVDLAPLSRRKAAVVADHPDRFAAAAIVRVEIDFRTQRLADRLAESGFAAGAATFVVWEGVSMYLDAAAVHATLDALAALCGADSVLAMDFWRHVGGRRPLDRLRSLGERAIRLIGEPVTFVLDAPDAGTLLAGRGFDPVDIADADALTTRYATDGRHCDPGLFVVAARRG